MGTIDVTRGAYRVPPQITNTLSELTLDQKKLVLPLGHARRVAERFPGLVEEFVRAVARQQQIESS